jgi:hypothetical protein
VVVMEVAVLALVRSEAPHAIDAIARAAVTAKAAESGRRRAARGAAGRRPGG